MKNIDSKMLVILNELWKKANKTNDETDCVLKNMFAVTGNTEDEEMLKAVANGVYGEHMKQIMLDMALKPRKYNTSLIMSDISEIDGVVISLDPNNISGFNPLKIDTKNDVSSSIANMDVIERLKRGGFKTLLEVSELVDKVCTSNDPISNSLFDEWWEKDSSKDGLLVLIKKLNL